MVFLFVGGEVFAFFFPVRCIQVCRCMSLGVFFSCACFFYVWSVFFPCNEMDVERGYIYILLFSY